MTDQVVPGSAVSSAVSASLLTFLLADIRGYTAYTAAHGDDAAARHSERFLKACRDVAGKYDGHVFGTAGDQALLAFTSARQAIRSALALQLQLDQAQEREPEVPWRAGVGLDTGDAVRVGGDYRGGAINLAARLCALAGPGDILASQGVIHTAHAVEGVAVVDRGEVILKGLDQPMRVVQLFRVGEQPDILPPLQPLVVERPTNLPDEPTPFVGRGSEIRRITKLLAEPRVRLVSLTGAGGTGKTRLALQVGATLLHDFRDGVFFVDLAPLSDPALVSATIGGVLGVREEPAVDIIRTLTAYLRDKHLLLILDNFEHLPDAASAVASLLDASRQLHILVTTRVSLHLSREHEHAVPPLDVPTPDDLSDLSSLERVESVALFLERARAVRSDIVLTWDNAASIAAICARLDGLPLAIELAAARIKLFPPQALLQRLEKRLSLLTGGARDRPTRQQTLRNTIEWSYSLLDAQEQALFARLSVFAGGCDFDAAEAVCNPRGDLDLVEGLANLVDKSLLRQEGEEDPRFSMLETIREYASERLIERDEEAGIRTEHADYFTGFAEQAEPALMEADQAVWLDRLEREHDNLRAALRWSRDHGDQRGSRLAAALWRFWYVHGHYAEGWDWLNQQVTAIRGDGGNLALRARILNAAGNMAYLRGDSGRARELLEQAVALRREMGDAGGIAKGLNNLANVAQQEGNYERAKALYEESLRLKRQLGDTWGIASSLNNLGNVADALGDFEQARALHEESLGLKRALGDRQGIAFSLRALGIIAAQQQDQAAARTMYGESLQLFDELGDKRGIALSLAGFAALACSRQEYERAARLLGSVDQAWATIGGMPERQDVERMEEVRQRACAGLGPAAYNEAIAQGHRLSLRQAIAEALTEVEETSPAS